MSMSGIYASSASSIGPAFLGISANMAVPFEDSKFLELVFLNRVCGRELDIC
jgi:hypothetical protein